MRVPIVGDVYYRSAKHFLSYTHDPKHVQIIGIFKLNEIQYVEFSYFGIEENLDMKAVQTLHYSLESFLEYFNYLAPEEYDEELNRLLNEDMIRDIIE